MTVILRRNEALELNLVEYRGKIAMAELQAVAKFQADKPELLVSDCLNRVCADADFSAVTFAMLEAMFDHYRQLFSPLRLQIFRRAVWLCEAEGPRGHVEHWLSQDTREGMSSNVKHCCTFADAADWLLLMDAERGLLERAEGFDELARFHFPPQPAIAAAR